MKSGLQPYGGGKVRRRGADLYPTEPAGTEAFIRAEADFIRVHDLTICEPACGPGFMAKVLMAHGFAVIASDLHDHDFGEAGLDFTRAVAARSPVLVTNPPYGPLAARFIVHAIEVLGFAYVALLLKSDFWHAGKRRALFERLPPSVIHPVGFRLHWDGRGRPVQTHSWNVWDIRRPALALTMPALIRPLSCPDVGFDAWVRGVAA